MPFHIQQGRRRHHWHINLKHFQALSRYGLDEHQTGEIFLQFLFIQILAISIRSLFLQLFCQRFNRGHCTALLLSLRQFNFLRRWCIDMLEFAIDAVLAFPRITVSVTYHVISLLPEIVNTIATPFSSTIASATSTCDFGLEPCWSTICPCIGPRLTCSISPSMSIFTTAKALLWLRMRAKTWSQHRRYLLPLMPPTTSILTCILLCEHMVFVD